MVILVVAPSFSGFIVSAFCVEEQYHHPDMATLLRFMGCNWIREGIVARIQLVVEGFRKGGLNY